MRARDSIVYTPVSLGPDTDDEETLVNAEVYNNGEFSYFCYFSLEYPNMPGCLKQGDSKYNITISRG